MKVNKLLLIIALACICFACGNKTAFNPQEKEDGLSNAEREKLIEQRRAQANATVFDEIANNEGKIKVTVLVPDEEGLGTAEQHQLENKMIQMATLNGIGGLGGNPRFVLAPMVNVLKEEATSTAPVRRMIKYDITFYIADIVTGTVFGSYNTQVTGVGDSKTRAFLAAFNEINPKDAAIQKFISDAQTKLVEYYKTNGANLIKEADMLAAEHKYAQAVAILGGFPGDAEPYYSEALKKSQTYFAAYLENECETTLAMMRSAMASGNTEEALNYYKMIKAGSNCKATADNVYAELKAGVDAKQQQEWEAKMAQAKADNDFRAQEAELKARVEISGNKCLLDKYKKDAAYNRLPWIRKVVHLGDIDPFDGYKPDDECGC